MRQGDGSDLLGQDDPRNPDIGVIYVEPKDNRQEVLTAITTQELQGRKQIAIVLPEQGKAFRQPVDFDGLKNMRRQLKAQLIFIAPPGPGPAEFARQRRFTVYSSLDTFKSALLNEAIPTPGPRMKSKHNLLQFGSRKARSRERTRTEPSAQPPVPPTPRLSNQQTPLVMPPTPPTPKAPQPAGPLGMSPATPRGFNQPGGRNIPPVPTAQPSKQVGSVPPHLSGQAGTPAVPHTPRLQGQQVPPTPRIEEIDTVEVTPASGLPPTPVVDDKRRRKTQKESVLPTDKGTAPAAGAAAGMLMGDSLESDDDALYAPTAPIRNGPPAPIAQGSTTPSGIASGPARPDKSPQENRPAPGIIAFPAAAPATPKLTGQAKPPRGARGTVKLPAAELNAQKNPPPTNAASAQPAANPPATNQPGEKSGKTGKTAAIAAGAGAALGAAAMLGASGQAGGQGVSSVATAPGTRTSTAGTPPTAAAGAGGLGTGQRPSGLTPLPPPYSRWARRRRWQRTALLLVLLLLLSGLVAAGILAQHGSLPGLPGNVKANVIITPGSHLESDNYLFAGLPSGTPDPAQHQVAARMLTQSSGTSTATANATGSIQATRAHGLLRFINTNNSPTTILPVVIFGNDGVGVSFGATITVPVNPPFLDVNAFAVNAGANGNIGALDISKSCCASGITVKNFSAFSGGQDAQPNNVIQQSDIDHAAQPLINSLKQSTANALQKQVKSGERVVDNTFNCSSSVTSQDKPGTVVKTTSVDVKVTCSEEVYNLASAQSIATSLLQTKAQNDPAIGPQYVLDGNIVTSVLSATKVSSQGQLTIEIQAQGLWVYQFNDQLQQNIKQSLVKLSKTDAQSVLLHAMGVAGAQITLSTGTVMPSNANDITLVIQRLPGVQNTPSTPIGSPTALPTNPASTPTPVNGLGGS